MSLVPTASQTVGPFFSIGLGRLCNENIFASEVAEERIAIEGRVIDGNGVPVPDAVLEIWQADAQGVYPSDGAVVSYCVSRLAFAGSGASPPTNTGSFVL